MENAATAGGGVIVIGVDVVEHVSPLATEWDALVDRLGAAPFFGPDWIGAHWRAFGAGRLTIITIRRDGRLGAVLPLARRGKAAWSVTSAQTPQFGLVTEDTELAGHAIDAIAELGISRLVLSYIDGAGPLAVAVRERAVAHGQRLVERVMLRSPFVELEGTLADYRARLSSSFRADLRRRNRRLAERGDVQLDVRDGLAEIDELLAQGWELEASGWKGRLGTAVAARVSTQRFYAEIAHRAAARGRLRLCFLRLDGCPIAFIFALEQRRVLYLLKGGFDPAHARFSPGLLLLERLIERAFATGLGRIELLGGEEPYKLRWSNAVHERVSLQSFEPTPVRSAQWVAHAYGRPLALRIGLDGALKPLRDRARMTLHAMRELGGSAGSRQRLH